jgi:hypothetical protein
MPPAAASTLTRTPAKMARQLIELSSLLKCHGLTRPRAEPGGLSLRTAQTASPPDRGRVTESPPIPECCQLAVAEMNSLIRQASLSGVGSPCRRPDRKHANRTEARCSARSSTGRTAPTGDAATPTTSTWRSRPDRTRRTAPRARIITRLEEGRLTSGC